jgi:coenzyme F420 hydrogenase subunit delta
MEQQVIMPTDAIPEYCNKPVLVLGCGNVLFGDDGFGPAVIERIQSRKDIPKDAYFINAGSSVREILFDLILSEKKPKRVIIVDAMECGADAGSVVELNIEEIPQKKIDDFSMHQLPTSNLLKEMRDFCGVEVNLVVLQPANIPEEVEYGLSEKALGAIEKAVDIVMKMCVIEESSAQTAITDKEQ